MSRLARSAVRGAPASSPRRSYRRNPHAGEPECDGRVTPGAPGHTVPVKRVALLGATGSIGRQALEIVEAHPELELVAAASGSTPIDGLAPLTQVGRRPDRAARAGRAGRRPQRGRRLRRAARSRSGRSSAASTSRSRTRRASSPPASSRSRRRSGEEAGCCPSTASTPRPSSASRAARAEQVDSLVLTASGGPFRGRTRDELDGRHARGGARPSDLEHGAEDHDRLGDAREQGPRADRGALPVRPARTTGSRSSSIRRRSCTRSSASATARRSRTSATRTCACRSRTRSPTRSARRRRCRRSTSPPA